MTDRRWRRTAVEYGSVFAGGRTWLRLAVIAGSAFVASCMVEQPSVPLPREATPLRTPRDMDGVWLDVQAAKVREVLTTKFGRVSIAEYRLEGWTWEALCDHFDAELGRESMARHAALPRSGRHYRLAVWTRNGNDNRPMIALAEVEPPPPSSQVTHRVLLIITPRQ